MVFSSDTFIFCFLPMVLLGYYILPMKCRNCWLLALSLLFYAWGGLTFLPIICASIILNYVGGYVISLLQKNKSHADKFACVVIIAINLLILFYWKYLNFFGSILDKLFDKSFHIPEIILPIGISFFTFQGLSYVVDVYRKKVPVQKNIIHVGLYIALFPQLIAGPIVRYSDINTQIVSRTHSAALFTEGISRFTIGLAKKAILANSLAVNADAIFNMPSSQNTPAVAWIGALSYSLQIYFDFSGYSDMAIGLGKMFGFHIPENFNYPYISSSISEFWRRWHISLGAWLRDYIYIPLGGSRKGVKRKIINTLIVFTISGIWHGANWTFIFWGIYYGVLISLSILFQTARQTLPASGNIQSSRSHPLWSIVKILFTDFLVLIGWVLFKSASITDAFDFLKSMFGLSATSHAGFTPIWYLTNYNIVILLVSLVAMLPIGKNFVNRMKSRLNESLFKIVCAAGTLVLLLLSLMYVVTATYNPFIYFQF